MKRIGLIGFLFLVAFVVSCQSTISSRGATNHTSAEDSVKDTFLRWREYIIKNRWEDAYHLTGMRLKQYYNNSFEEWKEAYQKSSLVNLLLAIKNIKDVAVSGGGATISVLTTNNLTRMFTADDENGVWKISGMVRPPLK